MPSQNQDWPLSVRLALLLAGWATAGYLLYVLATLLPPALLATIAIVAWIIVKLDRAPRENKSLAWHLCGVTSLLTAICAIVLRVDHRHEGLLWRLLFVGVCLGAGLILLDRRADGWQL